MAEIGKKNRLEVIKELDFGSYLDGGELGEILLPRRYVPKNSGPGSILEVFLYFDSEDRIIATTEKPLAMVGEFACLKVVSVESVGAFLDWGLKKDLLVPFREQKQKMERGRSYVVFVYFDEKSRRIAASSRLEKFLDKSSGGFREGDEVDLLIYDRIGIGYKAIVNRRSSGLLYDNEVYGNLKTGERLNGFIKKVREDNKIDLSLFKHGPEKDGDLPEKILEILKKGGGFMALSDRSSPHAISVLLGVSKKTFKKAIGSLYKKRIIVIEDGGIRLKEKENDR
jgi:predicted RNA-binding protein (virulence factor B family)